MCALVLLLGGVSGARADEASAVRQDVDAICALVPERYVYFEARAAVWPEACEMARVGAESDAAATPSGHVAVLERLLDQLHDNHVSLGTNTARSPRLVPSGSDYRLELIGGAAVVNAVRPGSGAAKAGLSVGDTVLAMNGEPVLAAAARRIRAGRGEVSPARLDWALNAQAAGVRGEARRIEVQREAARFELELGAPEPDGPEAPVTARRLEGNIGYIRFEDSLGRDDTVEAFDAALEELRGVDDWVIDLRNTPGGGNTDVAEPVLGRFIRGVKAYQVMGPRWQEEPVRRAASRGPWRVKGPVAVLAGAWTGSMGEGMVIGFDALLGRAEIFGSPMAGLAGGVEGFELPGSGIGLRLPAYNLLHLDGTDRHEWVPPNQVRADNGDGPDLALDHAVRWLERR